MKCPYYQGVCGLDESVICYANSDNCNIYKDHEESLKEIESKISLVSAMLDEDGELPFEGRCLASLYRNQLMDELANEKEIEEKKE